MNLKIETVSETTTEIAPETTPQPTTQTTTETTQETMPTSTPTPGKDPFNISNIKIFRMICLRFTFLQLINSLFHGSLRIVLSKWKS